MKMFKFLAVLLVVCALATTLVGCDLGDTTTNSTSGVDEDVTQRTDDSTALDKDESTTPDMDESTALDMEESTTPSIPTDVNNNSETTDQYDGIVVTKLPYVVKGIIINSISFSETKVTVNVTNNTGDAIKSISSVTYKCYDSTGAILQTGDLYLADMDNGESAEVYFYAENGTSKILFVDATIYEGEASGTQETQVQDGITINKLPLEIKGLKVTGISFDGTKVAVCVTNNTGNAVKSISSITYKCYDSTGTILQTGDLYLADMNNGESAEVYFYAENGTSKVLFVNATIYEGEASGTQETQVQDGITINKLPIEIKGLKVTGISFDGTKVTVCVTNNTGHAIKGISSITYKCYDSADAILQTGELYLAHMNNGESAKVYFYAENGTSKILFIDATIYE